jgi:hypothetical protein
MQTKVIVLLFKYIFNAVIYKKIKIFLAQVEFCLDKKETV